jgi:pre-mRNA-processing factor 40
MQQFVNEGNIKARTKWKQIYPLLSNDDRYLGMLGNPGSNPLELFWDVVDNLDQKLDAKIAAVNDVIRKHNVKLQPEGSDDDMKVDGDDGGAKSKSFVVGPETTEEELVALVRDETNETTRKISHRDLKEVYQNVSWHILPVFVILIILLAARTSSQETSRREKTR